MTGEKLRHHPSVIIQDSLQVALFMIFFILFGARIWMFEALLVVAAIMAIAIIMMYWRWRKTTIQFNENDLVVERNTIFALKKTIPYSKIASVNLTRGIVNRVFRTSTLKININSLNDAVVPEARLVFGRDLAEKVRNDLYRNASRNEPEMPMYVPSSVQVSPFDIVLHGMFSQSTFQTLFGIFFLGLSVVELRDDLTSSSGGDIIQGLLPLFMFILLTIVPTITSIVQNANFKVYRLDDTIYLEHGLVSKFKTSFKVSKINAVHVRSTLVSRMLGRSFIEAEVIGLGLENRSKRPVLCPLKRNDVIEKAMADLVPEFVHEHQAIKQPRPAMKVIAARTVVACSIFILVSAILTVMMYDLIEVRSGPTYLEDELLRNMFALMCALMVLTAIFWAHRSYKVKEISLGADLITVVTGALDRKRTTTLYDKIQIVTITKGPLARRYGLATAALSLLSSTGGAQVTSGYYTEEYLNGIHQTVMGRLSDGRYERGLSGTR